MNGPHERGRSGERRAEQFLRGRGLRPLARNYRCRGGEIDLVMLDGPILVFIEVRYRRSDRYGSAEATVTAPKQRRIIHAARHFLSRHRRFADRPGRFDVVAISGHAAEGPLTWLRGAFGLD